MFVTLQTLALRPWSIQKLLQVSAAFSFFRRLWYFRFYSRPKEPKLLFCSGKINYTKKTSPCVHHVGMMRKIWFAKTRWSISEGLVMIGWDQRALNRASKHTHILIFLFHGLIGERFS